MNYFTNKLSEKENRRRYKLHYNLRKTGNIIDVDNNTIIKRDIILTKIENKWINELLKMNYTISNNLFSYVN